MPDIYHLVFIESSLEKIYEAASTQEGIASWWSVQNNAKQEEGSIYKIYFGTDYYKEIKVTELVPNIRIAWEILDAHPEWLNTKVSFDISAGPKTAELRFKHSGWKDYTDMFAQCNHHWGIYLQNLKAFVETGEKLAMNNFGKNIPSSIKK